MAVRIDVPSGEPKTFSPPPLAPILGVILICVLQFLGGINLNTISAPSVDNGEILVAVDDKEKRLDDWLSGISGANETTCPFAFQKKLKGEWEDPNRDQQLYRRIKTEPHFYVSVHKQEYDSLRYNAIYRNGNYYEGEVIRRFEFILKENRDAFDYNQTKLPLVIDIGGNIGFYSLLSAAWMHGVVTFEINPANVIRICESLHLNLNDKYGWSELSHPMMVKIHQQGVSDVTGNRFQVGVHRNPGQTTLENAGKVDGAGIPVVDADARASARSFLTTTVTLDDFANDRGWFDRDDTVFSILKIDTEGHELQILNGAKQFLKAQRAKNILIEYRAHCRPAMDILFDAGYVIVEAGGLSRRKLTKDESIAFINQVTKTVNNYADLWFRLDLLPLIRGI